MSLFGSSGPSGEEIRRETEIKQSLTSHLQQAIKELQKKHVNSEEPIQSEDTANAVCCVVEAVFLHGLKPSISKKFSGFLGGVQEPSQLDFWEMLTRFSHRDNVSQLNHLGQITTRIGMCRAWIRLALNDSLLESYMTAMSRDARTLHTYYRRTAYLRDMEHPTIMISYLQGLSEFEFSLSYNSSVLNIWTSSPLCLAGLMHVQTITPRPVIKPAAAEEAIPGSVTGSTSNNTHTKSMKTPSSKPNLVTSMGYTDSALAAALSTPPSLGYDPSVIPRAEMEQIRKLIEEKYSGSEAGTESSTATSQVSCPDDTDQRSYPQQNISPHKSSLGHGKVSGSNQLVVPGVVRSKVRSKSSAKKLAKKKKMKSIAHKDVKHHHQKQPSDSPASSQFSSQTSQPILETAEPNNKEIASSANNVIQSQIASERYERRSDGIETDMKSETLNVTDSSLAQINTTNVNINVSVTTVKSSTSTLVYDEKSRQTVSTETVTSQQAIKVTPNTDTNSERLDTDISNENEIHSESDSAEKSEVKDSSEKFGQNLDVEMPHQKPQIAEKSGVEPQMSTVIGTADGVDDANEADPSYLNLDEKTENQQEDDEIQIFDDQFYTEKPSSTGDPPPVPRGNSLDFMQTWSTAFQPTMYDAQHLSDGLVGSAGASAGPSEPRVRQPTISSLSGFSDLTQEFSDGDEGFEILTDDERDIEMEERVETFKEALTSIQHERGLDFHNFQCKGCKRPVGLFFCSPRVCAYDGGYYCYECHENNEFYIPARIVHNWDFCKYPVSRANLVLLRQFEDTPLLDVNQINPRLYDHVPEMREIQELRIQLRFLKAYMFTCRESTAEDLRRQLSPKEYLCDDIHMYALLDLLQVPSGELAASLRRVIKMASGHVMACGLCSGKGFICEICHNPKVIYPFQLASTSRCGVCDAVYHKACKTALVPCPKCQRRLKRQIQTGDSSSSHLDTDYAYSAET